MTDSSSPVGQNASLFSSVCISEFSGDSNSLLKEFLEEKTNVYLFPIRQLYELIVYNHHYSPKNETLSLVDTGPVPFHCAPAHQAFLKTGNSLKVSIKL